MKLRPARALAALALALTLAACGAPSGDRGSDPAEEGGPVRPDGVEEAVWSADGRRLAVTWTQGGLTRLIGLYGPHEGAPPEEATGLPLAEEEAGWASWSPDDLWLAYAAGPEGGRDVYRARPDGTGAEQLTTSPSDDYDPAYSPDGRTLAFVSDRDGGVAKLYFMPSDGGEARPAAELPGPVRRPMWAPDGRRLVVEVTEGAEAVIYLVAAEGGGWGRFAPGGLPSWSPDGERILFVQEGSVYWRPVQGGGRVLLVEGASSPRLSPDGKWVAFVRAEGGEPGVYIMELETMTTTRITPP